MQYEITADAMIIVCRLEPVSEVSIEINSDGKFVLVNTKKYKAKTYTREILSDKAYNIYSGNEIPM